MIGFCRVLDSSLFGSLIQLMIANHRLRQVHEDIRTDQYKSDSRLALGTDVLSSELDNTVSRLQRIEDKATHMIIGMAIAVALFGALVGFLSSDSVLQTFPMDLRRICIVILLYSLLQLILSGGFALSAFKIGVLSLPFLSDNHPISSQNHHASILLYCIERNRITANIRSNRLSASYTGLRNGLAAVFVLFVILLIIA